MTWSALKKAWTYAHISDHEFIEYAERLGRAHIARDMIHEDLENPQ